MDLGVICVNCRKYRGLILVKISNLDQCSSLLVSEYSTDHMYIIEITIF